MKSGKLKKILVGSAVIVSILSIVLAVHIYIVTRPKAASANTRAMARIDMRQDIDEQQAGEIATWLYRQKGVEHVMCNAANDNVVFTFFPVKNSADQITADLNAGFNLTARRYVPTEQEIQSGCPVSTTSSYKVLGFLKKLF